MYQLAHGILSFSVRNTGTWYLVLRVRVRTVAGAVETKEVMAVFVLAVELLLVLKSKQVEEAECFYLTHDILYIYIQRTPKATHSKAENIGSIQSTLE